MRRQRSILPILRCSHTQSRSAATAAKFKASGQTLEFSDPAPIPKKWSPLSSLDRPPPARSWPRSNDTASGHQPRNSERRHNPAFRPTSYSEQLQSKQWPSSPQQKKEKKSMFRKSGASRSDSQAQNGMFRKRFPLEPQSKVPQATTHKQERAQDVQELPLGGELEDQQAPCFEHDFDDVDDAEGSRPDARTSRLRNDPYKTRGSVVNQLHRSKEHEFERKTSPTNENRKPKLHLPRMKARPRMDVYIPSTVTVGTLSRILNVKFDRLIRKMVQAGMAQEATHDYVLTADFAVLLAEEMGRNPIVDDEAAFDLYPAPPHSEPSSLPSRPPIVTIMGHVDHGKTTLLDTLRSSAVAKGEAGGITQHIGAFSVPVKSSQGQQSITFLDTPGHAAFSAMRARGAGITDIVVLVVAADDGIMPQTREVINLLQKDAGKVGLVVAINKVDKAQADVEAVKLALMAEGIQLESLGGDIPSVEVSGLTGQGLPDLVETLSAIAELQDLRAEKDGPVHGYVLESKMSKGLGPVATVLVTRGCLQAGSHLLSGTHHAKVRVMNDPSGKAIKSVYPGMAVTVSGWKSLPKAGDEVLDGKESDIKKALANRVRLASIAASLADVDAINAVRKEERERKQAESLYPDQALPSLTKSDDCKELKLLIKADVSGSAEAVEGALQGIGNKEVKSKIVSSHVGDVTESDVLMAKAVNATIVAFSVAVPRAAEVLAAQNAVPIIKSPIIYRLMEDVQQRVIGLLPTIKETTVTGEATVLQLFDIQLKGKQIKKIAGCRVVNGVIEKVRSARIIRDGSVLHDGPLDTMRILKKDVTEVRKGSECGLGFVDFANLREGDLIQMYQTIEKPGVL